MPNISINGGLVPDDYETIATLTSAIGLAATKIAKAITTNTSPEGPATAFIRHAREVLITVEVAGIRWTIDGTTPTTTATTGVGHHAVAGDNITLTGWQAISRFRAINETGASGAGLRVTFFY